MPTMPNVTGLEYPAALTALVAAGVRVLPLGYFQVDPVTLSWAQNSAVNPNVVITQNPLGPTTVITPDTNSILLLHFDGNNGSTTFTDDYGHIFTAHGSAQLSTTQQKFGPSSLHCGGSTDWASTPDIAALRGAGDFTAECWFFYTAQQNFGWLCAKRSTTISNSHGMNMYLDNNGNLNGAASVNGTSFITINSSIVPSSNAWHHAALERQGSTMTLYLDGVAVGGTATVSGPLADDGGAFTIGAGGADGAFGSYVGYIDEFRYSTIARYTSNFTPTGPFSSTISTTTTVNVTPNSAVNLTVSNPPMSVAYPAGGTNV